MLHGQSKGQHECTSHEPRAYGPGALSLSTFNHIQPHSTTVSHSIPRYPTVTGQPRDASTSLGRLATKRSAFMLNHIRFCTSGIEALSHVPAAGGCPLRAITIPLIGATTAGVRRAWMMDLSERVLCARTMRNIHIKFNRSFCRLANIPILVRVLFLLKIRLKAEGLSSHLLFPFLPVIASIGESIQCTRPIASSLFVIFLQTIAKSRAWLARPYGARCTTSTRTFGIQPGRGLGPDYMARHGLCVLS